MKSIIGSLTIIFCFSSCGKIDKMKSRIIPDYSYKNAGIDAFYFSPLELGNTSTIPLIKPFRINNMNNDWFLDTDLGNLPNELGGGISPIKFFNVKNDYIFGYKSELINDKDSNFNMP